MVIGDLRAYGPGASGQEEVKWEASIHSSDLHLFNTRCVAPEFMDWLLQDVLGIHDRDYNHHR